MNFPGPGFFEDTAIETFSDLVTNYNYNLVQDKYEPSYVRLLYINAAVKRKIEVSNATNYTDYGFSFFIYNLDNNEYNILYNVPFEAQDFDCQFLKKAKEDLWKNPDVLEMINGQKWVKLTNILFRK